MREVCVTNCACVRDVCVTVLFVRHQLCVTWQAREVEREWEKRNLREREEGRLRLLQTERLRETDSWTRAFDLERAALVPPSAPPAAPPPVSLALSLSLSLSLSPH